MRQILAIVGDTWRQSKQQVVFILMALMLLCFAGLSVGLPKAVDAKNGKQLGIAFSDGTELGEALSEQWVAACHQTLQTKGERSVAPSDHKTKDGKIDWERYKKTMEQIAKARERAVTAATGLSAYRRAVEMWVMLTVQMMFMFSMWMFIAACAGYFPDMLAAGSVDAVLAKPLSRLRVFAGKYLGGLALFTVAIGLFCGLIYLGIGLRLGIWHARIFYALPPMIFTAALLYALMALVGILSRSTTLSITLGYFLYLVVDTAIGTAMQLQKAGMFESMAWLDKPVGVSRHVVPNFSMIKDTGVSMVLHMPRFEWEPFAVGGVWLVLSLALGFWIFRRRDY